MITKLFLSLLTSEDRELGCSKLFALPQNVDLVRQTLQGYEDPAASRVGRYQGKNQRTEETLLLFRMFKTVSGRARVNFVHSYTENRQKKLQKKTLKKTLQKKYRIVTHKSVVHFVSDLLSSFSISPLCRIQHSFHPHK